MILVGPVRNVSVGIGDGESAWGQDYRYEAAFANPNSLQFGSEPLEHFAYAWCAQPASGVSPVELSQLAVVAHLSYGITGLV